MSVDQVGRRLLCSRARVDAHQLLLLLGLYHHDLLQGVIHAVAVNIGGRIDLHRLFFQSSWNCARY